MKRIFTLVNAALFASLLFAGCAFTDYGNRISDERQSLESLERKRHDYESRYVIVLSSLEKHLGDPKLEYERNKLEKLILDIDTRIVDKRQNFENSLEEWRKKIAQDKLQKEMIEREEQLNANKQDGEWTK